MDYRNIVKFCYPSFFKSIAKLVEWHRAPRRGVYSNHGMHHGQGIHEILYVAAQPNYLERLLAESGWAALGGVGGESGHSKMNRFSE